jgi:hypothetical protein
MEEGLIAHGKKTHYARTEAIPRRERASPASKSLSRDMASLELKVGTAEPTAVEVTASSKQRQDGEVGACNPILFNLAINYQQNSQKPKFPLH